MSTSSETIKSLSIIKSAITSRKTYYCTEDEWRNESGFTDTSDFPSTEVIIHLENATEQIRKDAQHMVRWELVTKDSNSRYFTSRRYWGNRYGRDDSSVQIICGEVTKYDLEIYEADVTSSVAASLALQGSRVNRLMYKIPYDGIDEIDSLNCFFKLTSDWPSASSRQIYTTYWVVGKPLDELNYELKRACIEMTTILALKKLKTKRLKRGTVSYILGKQTITRDENAFDEMIKQHYDEYDKWIRWCRPFIGRRVKIGRMETIEGRNFVNRN